MILNIAVIICFVLFKLKIDKGSNTTPFFEEKNIHKHHLEYISKAQCIGSKLPLWKLSTGGFQRLLAKRSESGLDYGHSLACRWMTARPHRVTFHTFCMLSHYLRSARRDWFSKLYSFGNIDATITEYKLDHRHWLIVRWMTAWLQYCMTPPFILSKYLFIMYRLVK